MTLSPPVAWVLVTLILGLTAITIAMRGEGPAPWMLNTLVSGIVGALAPGTVKEIKQSMRPGPYRAPPSDPP
jgi:hypothetical protein